MSDAQINIAIAEALGWKKCRLSIKGAGGGTRALTAYGIPPNRNYEADCPNYCNDLNAMHEAEAEESVDLDWIKYWEILEDITGSRTFDKFICEDCRSMLSPTARQRAETFLKTLGKWEINT
jgi:hypothetical protein